MVSQNVINQAIKKLNNEIKKMYSEDVLDNIEFYVDEETSEYYQWKFETPDHVTHVWRYIFINKSIVKLKRNT